MATNKGNLLEDFSETLFNAVDGFVVRYKRAKAKTVAKGHEHDYDLIIQNTSTIFPEFGNYMLVECKDWKEPVGFPEISKFIYKLHSHKCSTGIIVAMAGVVYEDTNPTLQRTFNQDGIVVLILKQEDLKEVMEGKVNLASALRKKYEQVRFGVHL